VTIGLPLAGLVAVLALGASPGVGDSASAPIRQTGSCPKLSEAAKLPERRAGGVLRGDINGDGFRDRVSINFEPHARASCGFLLVVQTRGRTRATCVPEWYKTPQDLPVSQWTFAEPYVALIVRLDARRSQVVVAREHGASVVNISLYGIARGKLRVLHFFPERYEDKLPLFGTVGAGDSNARCRMGGPLIFMSRSPTSMTGRRWRFDRTDYRLSPSTDSPPLAGGAWSCLTKRRRPSQNGGTSMSNRSRAAPLHAAVASDRAARPTRT
jgi:hypothetical protein